MSLENSENNSDSGLKVRYGLRTDVGQTRAENQDAFSCCTLEETSLFVVADGMGGALGGAVASAIAANLIPTVSIKEDGQITPSSLVDAIEQVNSVIHAIGQSDRRYAGMGTTIAALALVGKQPLVAHVGDSRVYLFEEGELRQLTRDHTIVQELVDAGALSPEDMENHPISHVLTRCLGPKKDVEVSLELLASPARVGQKYLVCCDGLFKQVELEEIIAILKSINRESPLISWSTWPTPEEVRTTLLSP